MKVWEKIRDRLKARRGGVELAKVHPSELVVHPAMVKALSAIPSDVSHSEAGEKPNRRVRPIWK